MQGPTSLLDFILNLLKDPQAQAEFKASPEQVLTAHGLTGVCAADIHETLPLVTDNRAVELAGTSHSTPPPAGSAAGDSGIHGAIQYLHHITETYRYDDHGAHVHDAGHHNIWAVDDVTQGFDDHHGAPGIPDPGTSGVGSAAGTSSWTGYGQGDTLSHSNTPIYGDHTNSLIYGDSTEDSAGDQGTGHLRSFGSGASTTAPDSTSNPAGYSGQAGGSHGSPVPGTTADAGNVASTAGPEQSGHLHDIHGLGASYDDHGSGHDYYGDDDHGSHMYLHL